MTRIPNIRILKPVAIIIKAIANSTCPAKIAKPPMTNSGVLLAKLESTPETYGGESQFFSQNFHS